jgi:SpoVK/Ycf46/Vps4 family AAA+-type ATPase
MTSLHENDENAAATSTNLGPNALRVQDTCPALLALLGEALVASLDNKRVTNGDDTTSYWQQVHLLFVLRILIARTTSELATAVLERHKEDTRSCLPYSQVTPAQLTERLQLCQDLVHATESSLPNDHLLPRVAMAYQITPLETLVLQFLVTCKIQTHSVLQSLLPKGFLDIQTPTVIRYACGASPLALSNLLDEDHALCKDRILVLTQDEFGGDPRLDVSEESCRAFLGLPLTVDDKLKLSGTKLLDMVADQDTLDHDMTSVPQDSLAHATVQDMLQNLNMHGSESADGDPCPTGTHDSSDSGEVVAVEDLQDILQRHTEVEGPLQHDIFEHAPVLNTDDPKKPRRYTCELDYLKDQFDLVMTQVLHSRHRIAQDLRNASLGNTQPLWMRTTEPSPRVSVGEISAKLRLARRKIELSLELTSKEGSFYPRLELLVDQLALNEFEKSVLVYLAGAMISPIFKSCIQSEGSSYRDHKVTVGDLLGVFFDSFPEQVAGRTYFYRSSKLVRKGLVRMFSTYSPSDLTEQGLQLDRRVLDCIVGLDKESTEVSQGSHLYDPKISLDSVVLPSQLKTTIIDAVKHFDQFKRYRKRNPSFDDAISYGLGLTLMFCGPSGTGKTMTANAIAASLRKKLLLVNYPGLAEKPRNGGSDTSRYQSIFREAELSDAIIFFDECESLFTRRSMGGSDDTTELLTELERFEGIVFLATNRPFDLDEAMYRRISEVFDFKRPNYPQRLEIWKQFMAHETIPCEESIDWESIALQYELTGGFIKNAVIAALLDAVGRNPSSPCIAQHDIVEGCKKQVRGALQMVDFDERVLPRAGLEELIVSDSIKEQLQQIVSLEKARGILFGSWGFDEDMRSRQGTTALFWGASGTGRSRAAEAVGFELGKPLKVVDMSRLLEEKKGRQGVEEAKSVREMFQEARLMDAVLVLDGFSLRPDSNGNSGSAGDPRVMNLVVREMTRFPGVVIMMVDTSGSLDVFVSRLDTGLKSGLKFLVEFKVPHTSSRRVLWEKLMPPAVPTSEAIDFDSLARASDAFSLVQIGNAIYRAAAVAALRDVKKRRLSMNDLLQAIEEEKGRGESSVDRWVKSQYM